MASLVEELVSIIEEEIVLYQQLAEYGEQKRVILINADVPALEKLTALEQEVSDELLAKSNKQGAILKDISIVLGKSAEGMTSNSCPWSESEFRPHPIPHSTT